MAASTGGPDALGRLLRALGPAFPVPVVVALHAEPPFADRFPGLLDRHVPAPVRRVRPGMRLPPLGHPGVWVAPPGSNLVLRAGRLVSVPAEGDALRPSGDVLFSSLAPLRAQAAAVVLSGLERDGAEGLARVRAAGGLTLAQDPASARAEAMPRAAWRRGGARDRGPPEVLARRLWAAVCAAARPPRPVRAGTQRFPRPEPPPRP